MKLAELRIACGRYPGATRGWPQSSQDQVGLSGDGLYQFTKPYFKLTKKKAKKVNGRKR
jgi:hypothetical protein